MSHENVSSHHKKAILVTYVTLGIVFLCMIGINVFAYFTIKKMNEMSNSLETAAINIKLKAMRANLLYRNILSGHSKEDMNTVWGLLREAESYTPPLQEINEQKNIDDKIKIFRDCLVDCYTNRNTPLEEMLPRQQKLKENFDKLIQNADDIEMRLGLMIAKKMFTFQVLYIALLINFVIMFWFTLYTFRRYINQRKQAELELRNTQENLNTILNSLDSMVVTIDSDGTIMQWNSAAEKYFGLSKKDAVNSSIWSVVPFLSDYQKKIEVVFKSHKPKTLPREEINEKFFNISMNFSQGIDGVVLTLDDVTKQELREEQMRQSQKMEVVENLVGGLAHDFNNVLGAITGTISMIKFSLENKEDNLEDLLTNVDVIESATERAVVMVQQLLNMSQKHEISLAPVDLNMSVRHILKICENTFDKRIDLAAELYDVKVMVNADSAQIEQALLSLCDNAAQAMTSMRDEGETHGGVLTISIDKIYPDKKYRERHPKATGNSYWTIDITDTGIGMDKETLSKIFDPFFSKKSSEGTGLGLTMVNDIIKQHGGFIEVKSTPGEGTTFTLFLPELARAEEEEEEEVVVVEEETIPVGTGTIFVVDDEAVMRKTSKGILEKLGYDVIFAENGEEAVEVYRERYNEIRLTLLDMAMPKKNGKEAYIEMKKINPDLKVILVSGFKRDDRIDEVLEMGVNCFVKKPYNMVDLAQEIKRVLQSGNPVAASDEYDAEEVSPEYYEQGEDAEVSADGTLILKDKQTASGTAIIKTSYDMNDIGNTEVDSEDTEPDEREE